MNKIRYTAFEKVLTGKVFPWKVFPWKVFPWEVFPGKVFPAKWLLVDDTLDLKRILLKRILSFSWTFIKAYCRVDLAIIWVFNLCSVKFLNRFWRKPSTTMLYYKITIACLWKKGKKTELVFHFIGLILIPTQ